MWQHCLAFYQTFFHRKWSKKPCIFCFLLRVDVPLLFVTQAIEFSCVPDLDASLLPLPLCNPFHTRQKASSAVAPSDTGSYCFGKKQKAVATAVSSGRSAFPLKLQSIPVFLFCINLPVQVGLQTQTSTHLRPEGLASCTHHNTGRNSSLLLYCTPSFLPVHRFSASVLPLPIPPLLANGGHFSRREKLLPTTPSFQGSSTIHPA